MLCCVRFAYRLLATCSPSHCLLPEPNSEQEAEALRAKPQIQRASFTHRGLSTPATQLSQRADTCSSPWCLVADFHRTLGEPTMIYLETPGSVTQLCPETEPSLPRGDLVTPFAATVMCDATSATWTHSAQVPLIHSHELGAAKTKQHMFCLITFSKICQARNSAPHVEGNAQ